MKNANIKQKNTSVVEDRRAYARGQERVFWVFIGLIGGPDHDHFHDTPVPVRHRVFYVNLAAV
jgi:hypothetical protein